MGTKRDTGGAGGTANKGGSSAGSGKTGANARREPPPRILTIGLGVLLGFFWGSIMWGLSEILGRDSGVRGWLYIALTVAMIGGGVAAIFGSFSARRRGERIMPRLRRKKT